VNCLLRSFTYSFDGQDEYCPGIDPGAPKALRRILLVAPLFDEMNRTRRLLVSTMRALADRGIASFLPDLPGTNESTAALADQYLTRWQAAIAVAAEQHGTTHIASIRGGALVDLASPYLPHWRLSPAKGSSLLKVMLRTQQRPSS
jgi:alpha-beta hydrolase superfamily lysophospholipase